MPPKPPNILIFMTDQQRSDTLAPDHPCKTPNLDRFARQGISFDRCYTTAAHCCPARASLMTGLMPSGHGIHNNVSNAAALSTSFKPGVTTWSNRLADAGYRLGYTGKWHASGEQTPEDCGWSEVGPVANRRREAEVPIGVLEHPGFINPQPHPDPRPECLWLREGWPPRDFIGKVTQDHSKPGDRDIFEAGRRGLAQMAADDAPWCLMMSYGGPHDPFTLHEPYASLYDPDEVVLPPSFHDSLRDKPNIYRRHREEIWGQFTEREYRTAIAMYWGYCTMLDEWFGRVLDTLDQTGQADDTLVVYLSDHGEMLGDHGLFLKGIMAFDQAHRVPLAMRWPGHISPDRRIDDLVCLSDLASTFTQVAAAEPLPKIHGQSLTPYFTTDSHDDRRRVHYNQMDGVELYYTQRTVRTDRYRYTFNGFDYDELYDLTTDPHEMVNLQDDPRYEDVRKAMIRLMWQEAERTEDYIGCPYNSVAFPTPGPNCRLDPGPFPDEVIISATSTEPINLD